MAPRPFIPPRPLVRAVLALHTALQRAADLVVPPELVLIEASSGVIRTGLLHVAASLRIADRLEAGPRTAAELAPEVGANADALHRTLRALVTMGVFALDGAGRFRNNRVSDKLRSGVPGTMRDAAEYWGSTSNVGAWGDVLRTVLTGKNAFQRVHGVSVWEWFRTHPEEGKTFNAFMQTATELEAPVVGATYPFAEVKRLCDVAGGRGTLLAGVLAQHPHLAGVLVDAPHVADEARAYLRERGVLDRVEVTPGDFFTEIPSGCDAYMLKDILHDWDDARSLTILANVRRALPKGGRVLIVEAVVEPLDTTIPGPYADVHMMTVCDDGRQRSTAEFAALFAKSGFALSRIVPLATPSSVVEAIAV